MEKRKNSIFPQYGLAYYLFDKKYIRITDSQEELYELMEDIGDRVIGAYILNDKKELELFEKKYIDLARVK